MNQLDLAGIAKSFGLEAPPRVNLAVKTSGKGARKHKLREQLGRQADKSYYKRSEDQKKREGQSRSQVMYWYSLWQFMESLYTKRLLGSQIN